MYALFKVSCVVTLFLTAIYAVDDEKMSFSGLHNGSFAAPLEAEGEELTTYRKMPRMNHHLSFLYKKDQYSYKAGLKADYFVSQDSNEVKFRPLETYFLYTHNALLFGVGYQTYEWGSATGERPTDNINPIDFREGLVEREKIPIFSARSGWSPFSSLLLEGVFVPLEQDEEGLEFDMSRFSSDDFAIVSKKSSLEQNLGSAIGGGRITFSPAIGSLSLSYLADYDRFFTPHITYINFSQKAIHITLDRKRVHRLGADLKTKLGGFGIWGEMGYSITEDNSSYELRNNRLNGVVGFDFHYGSSKQHYANFQLEGQYIEKYDTTRISKAPIGSEEFLQENFYRMAVPLLGFETEQMYLGFVGNLTWDIAPLNLMPLWNFRYFYPFGYNEKSIERYGDFATTVEMLFTPQKALSFSVGAEVHYSMYKDNSDDGIYNEPLNKIGRYRADNRIYCEATYSWVK